MGERRCDTGARAWLCVGSAIVRLVRLPWLCRESLIRLNLCCTLQGNIDAVSLVWTVGPRDIMTLRHDTTLRELCEVYVGHMRISYRLG